MTEKTASQPRPEPATAADSGHLDLQEYPDTVDKAATLGHRFFRLSLTRSDVTDWRRFEEIRDLLLSMGTLVAMEPRITGKADLENFQGASIDFLFSTVLDQELLISLFPLDPEQLQLVPIPANFVHATPPNRVPAQVATLSKAPTGPESDSTPYAFPVLLVQIGPYRCALPPAGLREAVGLIPDPPNGTGAADEEGIPGREWFSHQRETLPLIHLPDLLGRSGHRHSARLVLIIQAAGNRFALLVDEVLERTEIVVQPLPPLFRRPGPITAAALPARGGAALLVDYPSLLEKAGLPLGEEEPFTRPAPDPDRPPPRDHLKLATFTLGSAHFAIDIRLIREINHSAAIPPLPGSDEFVHGLLNIRGQAVALCDLNQRLGLPKNDIGDRHGRPGHNIILKSRDQIGRFDRALAERIRPANEPIGLTVERLGKLRSAPPEAIQPVADDLSGIPKSFIQGALPDGPNPLILLNLPAILAPIPG